VSHANHQSIVVDIDSNNTHDFRSTVGFLDSHPEPEKVKTVRHSAGDRRKRFAKSATANENRSESSLSIRPIFQLLPAAATALHLAESKG